MASRVRVTDKDRGYKKRVTHIEKNHGSHVVTVGVHEDAGGGEGGLSIQEIATIHEFGIGNPQRSFIGAWADANEASNAKLIKALATAVQAGKLTEEQALNQFGLAAVGSIQARMAAGIPPPNAPSTVARKGSATPLIDKGILRSSITHEVKDK